jgi:hypothetical protein
VRERMVAETVRALKDSAESPVIYIYIYIRKLYIMCIMVEEERIEETIQYNLED